MTPSPLSSVAPRRAALPRRVRGLATLASAYDALICDIWGVVHNGMEAHPAAVEALTQFRAAHGRVLLMSNAPRPAEAVLQRLDGLGVARASWNHILTSGDMTRAHLKEASAAGRSFFHHGPERDAGLYEGLPTLRFVAQEEADEILLTGLWDDRKETPEDYRATLEGWLARKQRVVCANPDRQVQRGEELVWCAGALAEPYEQMGGEVLWLGKPYEPIFARAHALLKKDGRKKDAPQKNTPMRVLVIGDGALTDIRGANALGLDALFVLGGLTQAASARAHTPQSVHALLTAQRAHARYYCDELAWSP